MFFPRQNVHIFLPVQEILDPPLKFFTIFEKKSVACKYISFPKLAQCDMYCPIFWHKGKLTVRKIDENFSSKMMSAKTPNKNAFCTTIIVLKNIFVICSLILITYCQKNSKLCVLFIIFRIQKKLSQINDMILNKYWP